MDRTAVQQSRASARGATIEIGGHGVRRVLTDAQRLRGYKQPLRVSGSIHLFRAYIPRRSSGIACAHSVGIVPRWIMTLSLVLFVHITSVLGLFAGLALEAFGVDGTRKTVRRISGIAMALILLSGMYLAARLHVFGDAWLRVSFGAIVLMPIVGALGRRSDLLRGFSVRARTALALAIVFLMTTTPGFVTSLVAVGVALAGSALVSLPLGQRGAAGQNDDRRVIVQNARS
jgi:hypothetical protein